MHLCTWERKIQRDENHAKGKKKKETVAYTQHAVGRLYIEREGKAQCNATNAVFLFGKTMGDEMGKQASQPNEQTTMDDTMEKEKRKACSLLFCDTQGMFGAMVRISV